MLIFILLFVVAPKVDANITIALPVATAIDHDVSPRRISNAGASVSAR